MKRRIACIADTHCASLYGLYPPKWSNGTGNVTKQNEGQEAMWRHWLYFISVCRRQGVDTVIADGDLIQGQNPKNAGVGVHTDDLQEQIDIAQKALKPLMELSSVKRKHFIQGSGYHVDRNGNPAERSICEHFGGTWHGFIANLHFIGTNVKAHIIHGGSGAWLYRSQVLDRRNLLMNAAAGIGALPKFDIMIRAHWHYYQHIDMNGQHIIQVPCWCLYMPIQIFTEKYPLFQPAIGGVIITIDGDDSIHIDKYILPFKDIPKVGHKMKRG